MTDVFKRKGASTFKVQFVGFVELIEEYDADKIIPGSPNDMACTKQSTCVKGVTDDGKTVVIPLMEFLNFYEPADAPLNETLAIVDKLSNIIGPGEGNDEVSDLTYSTTSKQKNDGRTA